MIHRIVSAVRKRVRLALNPLRYRLQYPEIKIGSNCDLRERLQFRTYNSGASVEIGDGCIIHHDLIVECTGSLLIGDRTHIAHHVTLSVMKHIQIGSDCLIAEMVSIRDHDHRFDRLDIPINRQGFIQDPVNIGNNVWLGAKVTVMKGVSIGDNAIVGSNAVVTKDIPANSVAVGIPARIIRIRS